MSPRFFWGRGLLCSLSYFMPAFAPLTDSERDEWTRLIASGHRNLHLAGTRDLYRQRQCHQLVPYG